MADIKNTFSRKEVKYVLDPVQALALAGAVRSNLCAGEYGTSQVNSVYLDTPRYDAIARSVEKPAYKEKLRIRWYGTCALEDAPSAFVELKKKLKGVVHKRRLSVAPWAAGAFAEGGADAALLAGSLPNPCLGVEGDGEMAATFDAVSAPDAMPFVGDVPVRGVDANGSTPYVPSESYTRNQIAAELVVAWNRVAAKGPVSPSALVACERTAYGSDGEGGLRVTFDEGVRALDLRDGGCTRLLAEGSAVMEVKCGSGYPAWLLGALADAEAYPRSFSKYGEFYKESIASNA